jgi:hypothetical protein
VPSSIDGDGRAGGLARRHIHDGPLSSPPRFVGRLPRTAAMRPLRAEEAMKMWIGEAEAMRPLGFEWDSGGSR